MEMWWTYEDDDVFLIQRCRSGVWLVLSRLGLKGAPLDSLIPFVLINIVEIICTFNLFMLLIFFKFVLNLHVIFVLAFGISIISSPR
ncbi:hypothetical protein Syun_022195 [Stephania yunnanensis]|uniref:Transmembrane protein n=1 Tax=Stephania yunnanensis TaxID=152371 RepID=A0AAP0II20_9MAGN